MFRFNLISVFVLFYCFILSVNCHTCHEDFIHEAEKIMSFRFCNSEVLGAQFAWKYDSEPRKLEVLFGAKLDDEGLTWLGWGLNPEKEPKMIGTRALIGIKQRNGSLVIDTYNITRGTMIGCRLTHSVIELNVTNLKFFYMMDTKYYTIHATIILPFEYNETRINHVWQVGKVGDDLSPKMHAKTFQNFDSAQTIDLLSGKILSLQAHWRHRLRLVHAIMNIVGWGTLLPIGVIIARYIGKFPIGFKYGIHLHVSCQIAGCIIGSIGWGIGLWLGHASKYYKFPIHGIVGIFIFTIATLQMLATRLQPDEKAENRRYWNIYHLFLGYSLLATICFNIFKGIQILNGQNNLKLIYIGEVIIFACIFLAFETYTWMKFWLKVKNNRDSEKNNYLSSVQPEPNKSTAEEVEYSKNVPEPRENTKPMVTRDGSSKVNI